MSIKSIIRKTDKASDRILDTCFPRQVEINAYQPNVYSKAISIINFENHFLDFIADTISRFPNLMLGLRRFYARDFRNQNFMVTWFQI